MEIDKLKQMINECNNIVFFGGAGVSTESGIKDFRSKDGLYNESYKYPPEYMLSSSCFYNHTQEFYKYYVSKMNALNYEPNITHKYLTKLEQKGKLKAIITQNIDGLHQKAGSKNVLELHGSIYKNYCTKCNKFYDALYIFNSKKGLKCKCGGIIKPNVVLYGENLDSNVFNEAIKAISHAEMLIVAGTSLTVEPASSMIDLFNGKYLVIINKTPTPKDYKANLVINKNLKDVFNELGDIHE